VALPIPALAKAATVPLAVTDGEGRRVAYELATLPGDFPDLEVTAADPRPGTLLLAANDSTGAGPSYLFATDAAGAPTFYKKLPGKGFDFQRHRTADGATRYSYLQTEGEQLAGVSTFQGSVRLLDAAYQEIARLALLPNGDHGALPADLHEFVYLGDDHYILTAYHGKAVTDVPSRPGATSRVVASLIQEVEDGRVVFEWDSTAHPEFYAGASDGDDYANAEHPWADYMHMNAVEVDPTDGNLIVSFRHQDQVVKLDRRSGAVMWRLGGRSSDFPLTDAQRFSHQHFARRNADGTLSLFDNGNASQRTRLLTFTLDEAGRTVADFAASEPEARYSPAMGSYQRLDGGSSFVGWGAKGAGATDAAELAADGTPTFALRFVTRTYESYRALKYLD
jgi:hypothetical protein